MFRAARRKIAVSVSAIEAPAHFQRGQWLRKPKILSRAIPKFQVRDEHLEDFDEPFFKLPNFPLKFLIPKTKLYSQNRGIKIKCEKTRLVFFGFEKTYTAPIHFPASTQPEIVFIDSSSQPDSSISFYKSKTFNINLSNISAQSAAANIQFPESENITIDIPENGQVDLVNKLPFISEVNFSLKNEKFKKVNFRLTTSISNVADAILVSPDVNSIAYNFNLPDITDYLSHFAPTVYNIDLLNVEDFKIYYEYIDSKSFRIDKSSSKYYNVKVPDIKARILSQQTFDKVNFSNTNLSDQLNDPIVDIIVLEEQFKIGNSDVSHIDELSIESEFKSNTPENNLLTSKKDCELNLGLILKPPSNLSEEDEKQILSFLYDYQVEGAKFLSDNQRAILSQDFGTGKSVECIAGLKLLFRKREIRTALIICNDYETGIPSENSLSRMNMGWKGQIDKWMTDFTVSLVNGSDKERLAQWQQNSSVYITSYDSILNDLNNNLINFKSLEKYDCVILDEAQQIIEKYFNLGRYFAAIDTRYLWMISSIPAEGIKDDLISVFSAGVKQENAFQISWHKKKDEIASNKNQIHRQDYWLELDDEQLYEYTKILGEGKSKILDLYDSGNILRLHANVNFLIHQLKQKCNFPSGKSFSRKAELLLNQIKFITTRGEKVLVFTQYDNFGSRRIEGLLKENNIKYVKYLPGMGSKEMEHAKNSFHSDKSVSVFLASLRKADPSFNLADVPHVIHFDQWWNPASQLLMEKRIINPDKANINPNEGVTIYNYYTKNTVDEWIRKKLLQKGLLEKNIIESLGSEIINELVSEDDWMEIFDLPSRINISHEGKRRQNAIVKLQKLTTGKFAEKVAELLHRLGYDDIKYSKGSTPNEMNIKGTYEYKDKPLKLVVKCLTAINRKEESIIKFIHLQLNKYKTDKIFIVSSHTFKNVQNLYSEENVSFIPVDSLVSYLQQFKLI